VISDFVNVLKTNSRPDSAVPLAGDTRLKIVGQPVQSDGYVDDFQVLVSFIYADSDGIPDNPDEMIHTAKEIKITDEFDKFLFTPYNINNDI
jgi:hypothetical protein